MMEEMGPQGEFVNRAPARTSGGTERRLPVVVIAGRPNVGKSTLVNRIVGRRAAIVEEHPGVTRDRFELKAEWAGRSFAIIDTGGVTERGDALDRKVTEQSLRAIDESDLVIFVLDATTGPTAEDEAVASMLRRVSGRVIVVANKVDSRNQEADAWSLGALGFGDPVLVSALHGRGIGDFLDLVISRLAVRGDVDEPDGEASVAEGTACNVPKSRSDTEAVAAVAIVGRPNVGKSTLFNRLVGDDRSVVHDVPGTTRDAIDTIIESDFGPLRLIDTAGLRRKSRIGEGSEYYSLVRSLAAIDRADVSLLVIDGTQGVTHQDQRLAERVDIAGSPILIVLNKWDLLSTESKHRVTEDVEDRLAFLSYAPILRISALTGLGVHRLLPALAETIDAYHRRIPTGRLNDELKSIQAAHPAHGSRILYAAQGAIDPPTITLFATRKIDPSYLRYLDRSLRERFELGPTALKLRVRVRGGR